MYAINPDGGLKWSYSINAYDGIRDCPAFGPDGTIYVTCDSRLHALNPDGSLKWKYSSGNSIRSSAITSEDGTVYFGNSSKTLYAVSPSGSLKWDFVTGDEIYSSPVIGQDGTVYVESQDAHLYALTPGGSLKWSNYVHSPFGTLAIDAVGTLYVADDMEFTAFNSDGSVQWTFDLGSITQSAPAFGADGTLYLGCDNHMFYALSQNGSLRWTFYTGEKVESSPAIGADGTIYVGCDDSRFYVINPDGSEKLELIFEPSAYQADIFSSPAIASDNTVYVSTWLSLHALAPDGSLKWTNSSQTGRWFESSPTIGIDGTIYILAIAIVLFAR